MNVKKVKVTGLVILISMLLAGLFLINGCKGKSSAPSKTTPPANQSK